MSDYTELKRLADELIAANDLFNESPQDNEAGDVWSLANDRFTEAASPEVILALIADNDRLESEAVYAAAGFDAAREEVARLKAENEALLVALKGMTSMYGYCWDIVDGGLLCMQDNVQRFEGAHEAAQKVIAAIGKGEQS